MHTHSSASDGSLSPSSLIDEALKQGLSAIALTDHDTTGGLEEAARAAGRRGINFIPGIELEIEWKGESGGEFHLLGLGIKSPTSGFNSAVEELTRRREARNLEIIGRFNKEGIDVSYDEVKALAGGHSIGRPHFANLLVRKKLVKNIDQAFKSYLGRGRPFYIPKAGLDFELAAAVIRESGGIAVLAHPMSLYAAWGRLPALIKNLKERGLDGLEAWHPAAKISSCRRLRDLGKELGLCVTAGSDFHGETRSDRRLGFTAEEKKIDEHLLEAIPALGLFMR